MFKCVVRVLKAGDDNWPEVAGNMRKARESWMRVMRILSREGSDSKVSGLFFKAVFQAVLISVAETWVLTPHVEQALSSFHHRVAQRLTKRHPKAKG